MTLLRHRSIFFLIISFSLSVNAIEQQPATAFFYAANPPLDLLSAYERVVVEPDNMTVQQLSYLKKRGVTVYAYLSIGEVDPTRVWYDQIKDEWKQGVNAGWQSSVMDLSSVDWHEFILDKRMQELWQQGYRGFFLDTMDSYQLFSKTELDSRKQQQGMITLIKTMKQQYKDVHLLFNRGFEILDQVGSLADGVVAESLFAGWNPEKSVYKTINAKDREWLMGKLEQVRDDYGLPVTVIDYLPPKEREKAKKIAEKISQAGFIPWISTPELNYLGVGSKQLVPRKVLFLYDSRESQLATSQIHRFLAMPLEYLGYIPEYWDSTKGLPNDVLKGRYAGIVTWLSSANSARDKSLSEWVYQQIQDKLPVVFMGQFTLSNNKQLTQRLSINVQKERLIPPLNLNIGSKHIGFEEKPVTRHIGLPRVNSNMSAHWLKVIDSQNKQVTPVFIASWGGAALNPYVLQTIPALGNDKEYSRWIINPFEFLKSALKLKEIPVPDATTENGNRILTLHIDGDGFYNKSQLGNDRYSAEIILDEFIKPLELPHTVSVIEAEMSSRGLKPELSDELQSIAKDIFKRPNVEIASHSYSHPFNWYQAATTAKNNKKPNSAIKSNSLIAGQTYTEINKTIFKADDNYFHIPLPGYTYSSEREIKGSIDYINKKLAPLGKKTKVFLWTGDCLPTEEDLAWAKTEQVANMNGGGTIIRKGINSISNVSASGIQKGNYFQPYAPIQNENVYTNDWTGPFYGYQRVIETFKLTDQSMRLKPISIYYHFYSGERQSSLRALHRVYDWALKQEILPLWISEYTPRLNAFRNAVYEKIDNGWKIYGAEDLRTLRLPAQAGYPNLDDSKGVIGYRNISQGGYIALNGDNEVTIRTTDKPSQMPYLVKSNARVQYWQKNKETTDFRLIGHQAVTFSLSNWNRRCHLKNKNGKTIKGKMQENSDILFQFKLYDTGALQVDCEK